MSSTDFKPGCLGNIDQLEQDWALFVKAAKRVYIEQESQLRAPGVCTFIAKITLKKDGDSLQIISETNEKFPARVKGAVTAMLTRNGLEIFAPVQDFLPGVIRAATPQPSVQEQENE